MNAIVSEDYSVATNFAEGLPKILPVDPILNFLERADKELSKNEYFNAPLVHKF